MATTAEMATLVEELKADAKAKAQPPVAEEVKKEEVPEVKEVVEEVVKEVEKVEAKDEPPLLSARAQARIDSLIERTIDKEKKIAELEKKIDALSGTKEVAEPVYSKDQLLALIADDTQKQYHAWAIDKLTDIKTQEVVGKFQKETKMTSEVQSSYSKAKEEFPEMADASSALWLRANEIYVKKNLSNDPDGQYVAAVLASREIEKTAPKKEEVSDEVLQKRLDKEVGKKSLASVSKKVITSSDDVLAKLEKEALGTRSGSSEWMKYLGEMERIRLAKIKK